MADDVLQPVINGDQEVFQALFSRQVIGLQDVDTPYSKDIDRPALLAALAAATPLAAGEAHVGQVGGTTAVVSAIPAVTAVAYTAGQVIGNLMTFAGMARAAGGTGLLQDVAIQAKSIQTVAVDLVLFNAAPAASTVTNAVALSIADEDVSKVVGVVHLDDWTSLGATSYAQAGQLARAYKCATGVSDLFGALVARGTTAALGSTTDLQVVVTGLQD